MSAIGAVIGCFEAGKAYEDEGKFLAAARNYYQCHLYYEEGELPVFYEQVQEYGHASLGCYYRCKGKMNQTDKAKIRVDEVALSFLSSWRDKVEYFDWAICQDSSEEGLSITPNAGVSKAIEKTLVFTGKTCPYCGKPTELIDSAEIYGGSSYGPIYICRDCGAYVGCYKGTTTALGRLADEKLRLAKRRAHHYLDQLWKTPKQRLEVYEWLSDELHIPQARTHVGMSDEEQCNRIADLCRKKLIARKRRNPFRRFKEWEDVPVDN